MSLVLPTDIRKLFTPAILVNSLIGVPYLDFLGITPPPLVSFWVVPLPLLAWCCWFSAASVDGKGRLNAVATGFQKYPTLGHSRLHSLTSQRTPQCMIKPAQTSVGADLCVHADRPAYHQACSAPHSIVAMTACRWHTVPQSHHRWHTVGQVDRRIACPFRMPVSAATRGSKIGGPLAPPASTVKA